MTARYSATLRDQNEAPIPGALVTVTDYTGAAATLTNDGGSALANPFYTDAFGGIVFNTAIAGFYTLEYHYGGRKLGTDRNVTVGVPAVDPALMTLALNTGAGFVGANDGSGGSLYSTVQGFIAKLLSSAGSSLIGFLQAGTGAVARTAQAKLREQKSVLDFGAIGDGATNDYTAIQAAFTSAFANGHDVFFPKATYKVNSGVVKAQGFYCPNVRAEAGTILDGSAITDGPTLKIKGGSGQLACATISNLHFKAGTGTNSTGLEIADQCGVLVENCAFETGTYGLTFHNEASGGFTEYAVARGCAFLTGLGTGAVRYRVSGGTASFHGTGVDECKINMDGASSPTNGVVIESGALVYNAPMSFRTWIKGSNRTIVKNLSTSSHITFGDIGVEVTATEAFATATEIFGGTGGTCYHHGDIMSFGTTWLGPKAALAGTFTRRLGAESGFASGQTVFDRGRFTVRKTLAAGATVLRNIAGLSGTQALVHVIATGYDYRLLICATPDDYGGAGTAIIQETLKSLNTSGAGAPTFAVAVNGDLSITNAAYTSSYVAYVTFMDFGPSPLAVDQAAADYKPS